MGSVNSGNRQPRDKKPPEAKSRLYQFRLHPDKEQWAIDILDNYRNSNVGLREWALAVLEFSEANQMPVHTLAVTAQDVLDIKETLQWMSDQLQSGAFTGHSKRTTRNKGVSAPQTVLKTLDRFVGGGMVNDDDE